MAASLVAGVASAAIPQSLAQTYEKHEFRIAMRDGVRLYTAVYVPRNPKGKFPILLERTPYGCHPYGPNAYPSSFPGSRKFLAAGYAFAFQDVRGRFMSEGKWEEIRPYRPNKGPRDTDESTDAYDTVAFLTKTVAGNNGKVGVWGISYPGFYASMAAIDHHPAVKAVSPQAPVTEWFMGDDVHQNGAFYLQENFDFYFWFGLPSSAPTAAPPQIEGFGPRPDAYDFFLKMGPIANADRKYFRGRIEFWNDICKHPNFDEFWQARSVPRFLKNIQCAVLTVGGWFDAEDLYGALATYRAIRSLSPKATNYLVMGPWSHGMWAGGSGEALGPLEFGSATSTFFREEIEFPFFDAYLNGPGKWDAPLVRAFETGANRWHSMSAWPPDGKPTRLYLAPSMGLSVSKPTSGEVRYVSDPSAPVPYKSGQMTYRDPSYMYADQRFVLDRKDVLTFVSEPLTKPQRWSGPVKVRLAVSTTGTDADFIVKLLDVYPAEARGPLAGAYQMVRAAPMRAKFRNSFVRPEPLRPGRREIVEFVMSDVFHTFQAGHRMAVQVQSSWFPLVDRNPQTFCNIYEARAEDFRKATITIHLGDSWIEGLTP
jgi:putative CocE/NonD family hydrolase